MMLAYPLDIDQAVAGCGQPWCPLNMLTQLMLDDFPGIAFPPAALSGSSSGYMVSSRRSTTNGVTGHLL